MKVNCFSIYEFSDPDTGEILYVGSTIEPVARERAHRCTKPRLRKAKFRIIRVIPENGPVDRIEHQIIAAYKKRGQCCLNSSRCLNGYMRKDRTHARRAFSIRRPKQILTISTTPEAYQRFLSMSGGHSYGRALERLLDLWERKTSASPT